MKALRNQTNVTLNKTSVSIPFQTVKTCEGELGMPDSEVTSVKGYTEIYSKLHTLLEFCANKNTNETLNPVNVLHPKVRELLVLEDGLTFDDVEQLELSLINDIVQSSTTLSDRAIPLALFERLERIGREQIISEKRIVPVPNTYQQARVCGLLLRSFSLDHLLETPGFKWCDNYPGVRLAIDPTLARAGYMVPEQVELKTVGFRLYRWPGDIRPFTFPDRGGAINGR